MTIPSHDWIHRAPPAPVRPLPAGLRAIPARQGRDRYGNHKFDLVWLVPADPDLPVDAAALREDPWPVATTRRSWGAWVNHVEGDALAMAAHLVVAGLAVIEARTRPSPTGAAPLAVDEATCIRRTPAGREAANALKSADAAVREEIVASATSAAERVEHLDPGLAAGLRCESLPGRGRVVAQALIAAANDLADGISHDGPRAFSQTHFSAGRAHNATKVADAIGDWLVNVGADSRTIEELGLARATRIHVAGPVTVHRSGRTIADPSLADGLVSLRAEQTLSFRVLGAPTIVFVENLQAAEALASTHRDAVIAWTSGHPSARALNHYVDIAIQCRRAVVAVDADLGGLRIATRIDAALPSSIERAHVDVGDYTQHDATAPFSPSYRAQIVRHLDGPVAHIAAAVLERGHVVEQEAAIRSAVENTMGKPNPGIRPET
jgi:hypothetical protein